MDDFNNIYDIESPRYSQRKIATIEHSLHHALLHDQVANTSYFASNCALTFLISLLAFGVVAGVIAAILYGLKSADGA